RFFGGFFAFPGGRVSPADADLLPPEPTGPAGAEHVRCVTAARELFEEAGVLVARRPDGSFPASGPDLHPLRRAMIAERRSFGEVLTGLGAAVRPDDFTPVGSVTTPPFVPIRFDTTFFVAELPANQRAEVWPGELEEGAWTTAAALLERWT